MVKEKSSMDHIEYNMSQKQAILTILKEKGYRITNQRRLLIDIIFDEDCTCCKEIYYKAHKRDQTIGIATVYRMLNTLEEIGAIDRRNLYKLSCSSKCNAYKGYVVLLENKQEIVLSDSEWMDIISQGLKAKGYIMDEAIEAIAFPDRECVSEACC
ncbi:MAG: transcriptional repressor [Roseburia sp.]|nr:transcriptional repressor [Roseburia sp.]MCM1279602.1 transcriptional repressor [Robinsoniella sp.]